MPLKRRKPIGSRCKRMNRSGSLIVLMIVGILLLPGVVIGSLLSTPAPIAPLQDTVDVAVVGSEKAPVARTALELDSATISLTISSSISDAVMVSGVDTIVIIDTPITASDVAALLAFLCINPAFLYMVTLRDK